MNKQSLNLSQAKNTDKDRASTRKKEAEFQAVETAALGMVNPALLHDDRLSVANRQALAQKLGRIHGNRALQRYLDKGGRNHSKSAAAPDLQRGILDIIGDIAEATIDAIFREVVSSNVSDSSGITIPGDWPDIAREYAATNSADSGVLLPALGRSPTYHSGGWIMDLQPGAAAMTLDTDIFVSGSLTLGTYVHELVHVTQYASLGPTGFLVSYFGQSAATIARRLIERKPLNVMRSSPHEEAAYQLEQRFSDWHISAKGVDPDTITA
jgi:hypothetical protein